eukprot:XP_011447290.1 PREDICTED: C-type mannose receptor 2 [Crassostrea gigas]
MGFRGIISFLSILAAVHGDYINLGCDPGWTDLGNGYCYQVVTSKAVSRKNANYDCGTTFSSLVTVNNAGEMAVLNKLVAGYQSDGFWTSLTDLRFDGTLASSGTWTWDGQQALGNTTISWESYPTNNPKDTCGAINIQAKMTNWQCTRKMGFICELDQTQDTGCPFGWMITDNSCYYFSNFTDPTQILTWNDAKQWCANKQFPAGAAKLVTLDNPNDGQYILGEMPVVGATDRFFWTGLTKQTTGWGWFNQDTYLSQYVNWAKEPDHVNNNEDCAILKTDGKFSDQDCNKPFNYICYKESKSAFALSVVLGDCPQGWMQRDDNYECYYFASPNDTRNWFEAQTHCYSMTVDINQPAKLIAINDQEEMQWIQQVLPTIPLSTGRAQFWTGLNDRNVEGVWTYPDKTDNPPNSIVINWTGEPMDPDGTKDCTWLGFGGRYLTTSCNRKMGFICSKYAQGFGSGAEFIRPSITLLFSLITSLLFLRR